MNTTNDEKELIEMTLRHAAERARHYWESTDFKDDLELEPLLDAILLREKPKMTYEELLEDNKCLQAIFDMQWKRMGEATKLWQEATGKTNTHPDLGALLTWLIERGNK